MNIHKNARLTPKGREVLISRLERGERVDDIAGTMGGQHAHSLQVAKAVSRRRACRA